MQESIAIHKAVQDANRELQAQGYAPTVTLTDIALSTDNPPQSPSVSGEQSAA
jgi:hypothetical protein